jgi:hypothetical protein
MTGLILQLEKPTWRAGWTGVRRRAVRANEPDYQAVCDVLYDAFRESPFAPGGVFRFGYNDDVWTDRFGDAAAIAAEVPAFVRDLLAGRSALLGTEFPVGTLEVLFVDSTSLLIFSRPITVDGSVRRVAIGKVAASDFFRTFRRFCASVASCVREMPRRPSRIDERARVVQIFTSIVRDLQDAELRLARR